jgi:hypothetical protein
MKVLRYALLSGLLMGGFQVEASGKASGRGFFEKVLSIFADKDDEPQNEGSQNQTTQNKPPAEKAEKKEEDPALKLLQKPKPTKLPFIKKGKESKVYMLERDDKGPIFAYIPTYDELLTPEHKEVCEQVMERKFRDWFDRTQSARRNRGIIACVKYMALNRSAYGIEYYAERTNTHQAYNQCFIEFIKQIMDKSDQKHVEYVIESANYTTYHKVHNEILKRYTKANITKLNSEQIIALAMTATHDDFHNGILSEYVQNNVVNLDETKIITIARHTTNKDTHDSILESWIQQNKNNLTKEDFARLLPNALTGELKKKIKHDFLFE